MFHVRGHYWLAMLWLWTGSVAFAQAPDSEQMFSPLLEQAERDQQAGQLVEARARASAFLARVSVGSPLSGRAHLVVAATESVARRPAPSADVIFEPLVMAAEADGVAGRNNVALARLSAAMSLVPADSALAARARNLYALVSRGAEAGAATPAVPSTPQQAPVAPPPVAAQQPQLIVLTQQAPAPAPVAPPPVAPQPASSVAPKTTPQLPPSSLEERRHGSEMAELRLAAGALGLLAGVYTLTLLDADDPLLYLAIPLFTTVGMVLVAGSLDSGDGLPHGVPAAISAGVLSGFGDGLLIWGVARDKLDSAASVMSVLSLTTVAGAVIGGAFGYGMQPTIAESRFVLSAAVWSLWISLMSTLAFDTDADRTWTSALISYNVGIGTAMLISGITDITMERLALANGSLAAGALVGLMVSGVVIAKRDQDGKPGNSTIVPAGVAIGSAIGLFLGLALPENDSSHSASGVARTLADAELDLMVAPIDNGMTFGLTGKL